jgi:hypothetical protein
MIRAPPSGVALMQMDNTIPVLKIFISLTIKCLTLADWLTDFRHFSLYNIILFQSVTIRTL